MMAVEPTLRKSPYIFVLRTAVAELLFTFLLLGVALPISTRRLYEGSPTQSFLSFDLLVVFIFTILQVLIIVGVFLSWYFPTYTLGDREIRWRRNFLNADASLVKIQDIRGGEIKQGWLAQRLDYGSLILKTTGADIRLKNLARPKRLAELIDNHVNAEQARQIAPLDRPLTAILTDGENQFAEFKASLMWDYRRQSVNKDLYEPVMKNLVAFMNTTGGVLVIGVADDGQILGIEQDLSTLKKPNVDGFENVFNMAFGSMVGAENRQYVQITFPQHVEKTLCVVTTQPASQPVFLNFQGKEEFYIRAGNGSVALPISKATQYIESRFRQP